MLAVVLLGAIGAVVAWKMSQPPPTPPIVYVDAAPPPPPLGRNPDDDVPLPPPIEDAGSDAGKKVVVTQLANSQCEVKKCTGSTSSDLENTLQLRVKQARRCYNSALEQDPTLSGKVTVAVRVGATGQVCSTSVASNEMSSPHVAQCVASYFRGANFPAPKGGCVDVNIPINFVRGQ